MDSADSMAVVVASMSRMNVGCKSAVDLEVRKVDINVST
jgi:hypothetical protein